MTTKTVNSRELGSSFIALTETDIKAMLLFNKLTRPQKEFMLRKIIDAVDNKHT